MMVPIMASGEELELGHRIARNLQSLLRAKGINQGKLAERSGLSTSNISNLVNGRKNPSFYSVVKAALALDVDPLELAGFKPLLIPEAPRHPDDRLGELEERFGRFEQRFERFLEAVEQNAPSESRPADRGKRHRAS